MSDPKEESKMRVIDRRWWARQDTDAEPEAPPPLEDPRDRKGSGADDLEGQLMRAHDQLQAVLGEHRRATEEFEQVKVRMRRDVAREVERGRRAVLIEMLEVVDNLDRAIASVSGPEAATTLLRGVELVRDQFLAKLEGFGVFRLDVLGQPFDPQVHEAVSLAPVDDPSQAGLVIAIAREGYAIGEELLRPASVVVASHG